MRKGFTLVLSLAAGCVEGTGFWSDGSGGSDLPPGADPVDSAPQGAPVCVLGSQCEFDAECCAEHMCYAATCQPRPPGEGPGPGLDPGDPSDPGEDPVDICEDDDPSLAGNWIVNGNLYLGEGVNSLLGTVMDAVDELEDYLCPFIDAWMCAALVAVSDVNDMLDEMQVEQAVVLTSTGVGTYVGTETWTSVAFQLDGVWVEGSPEDIYNWEIQADDFTAHSCEGTLFIDEHHVSMDFCGIVQWAIDVAVWTSTDGAFSSLEELVDTACYGIPFCWDFVEDQLDDIIGCTGIPLLGFDYSGEATIASPASLIDGVWSGSLDIGGDFPGEFIAEKDF